MAPLLFPLSLENFLLILQIENFQSAIYDGCYFFETLRRKPESQDGIFSKNFYLQLQFFICLFTAYKVTLVATEERSDPGAFAFRASHVCKSINGFKTVLGFSPTTAAFLTCVPEERFMGH